MNYFEKAINDYNDAGTYEEPENETDKEQYIKGWTKAFLDDKQVSTIPTHVCEELIKRNEQYAAK